MTLGVGVVPEHVNNPGHRQNDAQPDQAEGGVTPEGEGGEGVGAVLGDTSHGQHRADRQNDYFALGHGVSIVS